MVIYLERGADLHMAQLMPLPLTVSCFSEWQWHQLGHMQVCTSLQTVEPCQHLTTQCVCVCVWVGVCVCNYSVTNNI